MAHPWDAQAQLVGDSFPEFAGPNSNGEVVEEWMDWMMDGDRRNDVILRKEGNFELKD